ncbi:MAG: protein kinase domain-containing protein [Acidobacteriota bacterium]
MKFCPACTSKYDDTVSFCPTDGEVLEEDPHSFVGSVLDGQYQIESLLGRGGMGAVYRARHILLGDRVAIKMLPPEMRSNAEWLRRFQREGQAARRFRHPNAVTVYDLRTSSDGMIYLVMEYVEGTTLDAELKKRGRFSPAEALATLKPVMSVLNAAHAMGVVHRDLKPENIMIGRAGTGSEPVVKLLDLGIAKLREVAGAEKTGSTNLTVAGQMLGTPYYMSPEQWGELPEDGSSEIDGRADLYSLGVVFYEIISGKRPFSGVTILELRKQHVTLTPKPLHEVASNVPVDFGKAIMRAMAKDRGDRQATAGALEKELEASVEGAVLGTGVPATEVAIQPQEVAIQPQDRFTTVADRPTPTVGDSGAMTLLEGSPPHPVVSEASTMPTVVVSAGELAARQAAQPVATPAIPRAHLDVPIARRRSPLVLIGAVALVFLILVGVGGYAFVSFKGTNTGATTPSGGSDLPVPMHEVGRYWIEVETENRDAAMRAGETVAMQSGESFKFHFSPNENGFLYIVGPGSNNAPTTFLTYYSPKFAAGVNSIASGRDFVFPADSADRSNWITLDRKAGVDEFTFVFSPAPLTSPAFFAAPAPHALTPADIKEWESFQAQARSAPPTIEVVKGGASPQTAVKVPQNETEKASVVFRVRIEHK